VVSIGHLLSRLPLPIAALLASLLLVAPARAADPVIAAAGDISCGSAAKPETCHQVATSDLLVGRGLAAVLTLGDNQYETGTLTAFQSWYEPSWGRVKAITHPSVGNHEYLTKDAAGYFAYFGAAAAVPNGWYSFDLGSWHLIALNSNCGIVSCSAGSPQETWLKADLAAHPTSCTLAYWHHPRFSSGAHGNDTALGAFWTDLYAAGADLVLVGHDHDYERFAPQTPDGMADPVYGIRELVVGTGGKSHYGFIVVKPNSEVRNADTFGVLELTLHEASYDWRFLPEAGKTFTDAGTGACHGSPGEPLLELLGPARSRLSRTGSIRVIARCASACTVDARASVTVGRRKIRSLLVSRSLPGERPERLRIKFSRHDRRLLRRALRRHSHLRAKVTVVAKDAAGRTQTVTRRIRVRR
jgi:acid phosphatase type 7